MARESGKLHGLSDKTSDVILVLITAIVMFIVAYPLYYVLVASFSDPYDVYAGKTFLLPSGFTFDGYKAVFADDNIFTGYLNSVKYTVIGTIFSVVMLYITAYPLSVKSLPGRKWISLFFVFTMYFGGGLVPTYLVVKETGLINNMWALFLPGGVAVGNMIIVRNYFQNSIPHDLIEAEVPHLPQHHHPAVHAHHGGHGGLQHGGLLERLVHRFDLPDRQREGASAPGAAQRPDQEFGQRQPGQHHIGRLCRAEQADRDDQVLLHHRGGRPHAHHLSLCPEVL